MYTENMNKFLFRCFWYRERSMELLLSLESNNTIAWCGMSDTTIGTLKPGASMDISLCFLTLDTGIIVSKIYL